MVVLRGAGFRCQVCNSPKKPLDVHHRTYANFRHEQPGDLTVLCRRCHEFFHKLFSLHTDKVLSADEKRVLRVCRTAMKKEKKERHERRETAQRESRWDADQEGKGFAAERHAGRKRLQAVLARGKA